MKELILDDVIKAIAQELKRLFPKTKVYDEGIEQGYEEPCFFIDYEKEKVKKLIGNRYNNETNFKVLYFQDFNEEDARYKVYKVRDSLNEGFDYIKYKDLYFRIKNKEIEINNKDLIFSFDIQFFTKNILDEEPTFNDIEKITDKEKKDA